MITEQILIRIIMVVVLIMILFNSYNVYRLSLKTEKQMNITNLEEMKDLHPLIKELYKYVFINGLFPLKHKIINDFIITNKIDKWIEQNKSDIIELIAVLKEFSEKKLKENINLEMDTIMKKRMYDLDIKQITSDIKKQLQ